MTRSPSHVRRTIAGGLAVAFIALSPATGLASPFKFIAKGQAEPGPRDGRETIAMECGAVLPLGALTSVSCYLRDADGTRYQPLADATQLGGQASPQTANAVREAGALGGSYATVAVFENVPLQPYWACVEAAGIQAVESVSDSYCE